MATRTRKPADERRRELAEVAAGHFHRFGFHGVSLAAVATDVGVTAPAVYRHFRNKNDLLSGAITTGLDHVEAALDGAGSLDEAVDRLAGAALDRPDVWVLLQREMRHLDSAAGDEALARFRDLAATFAGHVHRARPDVDDGRARLLTTAAFAVLATPSTRPVALDRERYHQALVALAASACVAELPGSAARLGGGTRSGGAARPGGAARRGVVARPGWTPRPGDAGRADGAGRTDGAAPASGARPPAGTGDRVLDAAVRLFHRHGYAAVPVDEVGEAIGIAGPSVFHHYPSKADLLVAAFRRAGSLRPVPDPDDLDGTVHAYVEIAAAERELFGVHATEEIHLPPAERRAHDDEQRAETHRWAEALRPERPDLDDTERELAVHAARGIVHDVVRVGRLHTRPGIVDETAAVVRRVLAGRG